MRAAIARAQNARPSPPLSTTPPGSPVAGSRDRAAFLPHGRNPVPVLPPNRLSHGPIGAGRFRLCGTGQGVPRPPWRVDGVGTFLRIGERATRQVLSSRRGHFRVSGHAQPFTSRHTITAATPITARPTTAHFNRGGAGSSSRSITSSQTNRNAISRERRSCLRKSCSPVDSTTILRPMDLSRRV